MNVYVLIEELEQNDFIDKNGYAASPLSTIVGIYQDRNRAEKEKEMFEKTSKEDVKQFNCDTSSYIIEERPIL